MDARICKVQVTAEIINGKPLNMGVIDIDDKIPRKLNIEYKSGRLFNGTLNLEVI